MNFLKCPHCRQQAASLWWLFGPKLFFLQKYCKHCKEKIIYDVNTLKWLLNFFFGGLFIGFVLTKIFPSYDKIFTLLFLGIAIIPIVFGCRLFAKQFDPESDKPVR